MNQGDRLEAHDAIDEIEQRASRTRAHSRQWTAVYLATFGVFFAAWYVAGFLVDIGTWSPVFWIPLAVLLAILFWRREVIGPDSYTTEYRRAIGPSLGLAVVVIAVDLIVPDAAEVWAAPLGLAPAAPFFYQAWRVARG